MKLAAEHWRSLSQLLDEALALSEGERESWVATLGAEHASVKPLLEELFARPAAVSTADLVGTLPSFVLPGEEADRSSGTIVGPYRLIRELGRGGMGTVWLAERADGLLKREVALKLPILAASRQALVERFAREREILAPLAHPHIARLYDAGFADDGQPYLALEYVAGEPVTLYCDRKQLAVSERVELFQQVLSAVQYAHANLVLHRDLKPSNIMVTAEGEIKLLDFGIAKLMTGGAAHETALTQLAGRALTPDYAAPEQISGAPLTTASDVYALGVVLYELLSGVRPYRLKRGTKAEIEEAILTQEVARPSAAITTQSAAKRSTTGAKLKRQIAGDLDTIVLKALRKAPGERYATAEAFALELARFLRGDPVLAQPASAWYRLSKFVARNKLALTGAGTVALALIAGASVALWQAHVARQETFRANASKAFVDRLFENVARSNPRGAAAGDTPARQLLALGSRELLDQSHADPELQLDLLQWLAHLNSELDLLEPASALSERSIALARDLHGADSRQLAAALAQKADNLYRAASYIDASKVASEALAIADKEPRSTVELRAKMHIIISNSAFQLDVTKTAEPQRHLEIALALLRELPTPSEDRSRAAYYLAWIKEAQHDFAAAEPYYLDGIAAGRANFGEKSFIVAFGYENYADMLRKEQRLAEARETIDKALQIYEFVLGRRHGTVAFARTTLALIEAASGRYAEAEQHADQALALARDVFGQDARQTGYPALYAARIKVDHGELAAAADAFDRAIAVFAATEPPASLSARMARVELAHILIALGRLERAEAVLDSADAGFVAAHDTTSVYAARATLAHAALAYAKGDSRTAKARLDQALGQLNTLKNAGDAALPRFASVAAHSQPSPADARAMLERLSAAGLLPSSPDALQIDIAEKASLEVAVGRLYTADGQTDRARTWLTQAVELRTRLDVPDSPWLADANAALAEALSASDESAQPPARRRRAEANRASE
ncbi:MAG: serine/threonine protein kinase [Betaproteobacteria bacterium]|nr:MAG: serine/threonine protein kinase [Betaproteobacteria bacterium]